MAKKSSIINHKQSMINTNWRSYRIADWGAQCLLTMGVLAASQGKWKEAIALGVFLLASDSSKQLQVAQLHTVTNSGA